MNILLIEDKEIEVAKEATKNFPEHNFDFATDYRQALSLLENKQYDLVITDIFFPEETGSGKKELGYKIFIRILINGDFPKDAIEALQRVYEMDNPNKFDLSMYVKGYDTCDTGIHGNMSDFYDLIRNNDETEQPLGVLIEDHCHKKNIPCMIVTSRDHHYYNLSYAQNLFNSFSLWEEKANKEKKETWINVINKIPKALKTFKLRQNHPGWYR